MLSVEVTFLRANEIWGRILIYGPHLPDLRKFRRYALVKIGCDRENDRVRTPLIERLAPGAPELAGFDATVVRVDHRRSTRTELSPSTEESYARRYKRWREWCAEVGYQAEPSFITTEKLTEFAVYLTTVKRYAPRTLWQSFRAIEVYAERAGVAISTLEARGVLDLYRAALVKQGLEKPRRPYRRGGASVTAA